MNAEQKYVRYESLDDESRERVFLEWLEYFEPDEVVDFDWGDNDSTRAYFEEAYSQAYCYYDCGSIALPLCWLE